MALPAITKTWTFDVNNSLPTSGVFLTDSQKLLFDLKTYLLSVGWTVKGSCNSVNYGMDGVDRWVTYANLVFDGLAGVRAWIVLKAPVVLSPNLEIMFHCGGTTVLYPGVDKGLYAFIQGSWTGFTGGTTNSWPTAPTAVTLVSNSPDISYGRWHGTSSYTAFSCVRHAMSAIDGTTRIIVCKNNAVLFHWSFEKLIGSTFADPSMIFMAQGNQYAPAYTHWNDVAVFHNYSEASLASYYLTAEGYGAAMVGKNITSQSDRGGGYWMGGVGVASASAGQRGRHGIIGDLWWGTTGLGYGTTIPDDGTKQFVQFNDMIFPWNGTTPLIA